MLALARCLESVINKHCVRTLWPCCNPLAMTSPVATVSCLLQRCYWCHHPVSHPTKACYLNTWPKQEQGGSLDFGLVLHGLGRILLYCSEVVIVLCSRILAHVCMCAQCTAMGQMSQPQVSAVYQLCIAEIYNSLQWLLQWALYVFISSRKVHIIWSSVEPVGCSGCLTGS